MIFWPIRLAYRLAFWTAVVVASLWISVRMHADTDLLRRAVRQALNRVVSDQIEGSLFVGRVERADLQRLIVHDVSLWSPDDKRIIRTDSIDIAIDDDALFDLRLRIVRATLSGGHVELGVDPDGNPDLIWAVQPVDDGEEAADEADPLYWTLLEEWTGLGAPIVVDGIQLEDMTFGGTVAGLSDIHARDLSMRATLSIHDEVEFHIHDAKGLMVRPFPLAAQFERLHGVLSSHPDHIVSVDSWIYRGDEQAHVRVWLGESDEPRAEGAPEAPLELDVEVDASPVSSMTVEQLGYGWAGSLDTEVIGSMRLFGPLDDLRLESQLMSDGGPINVHGRIRAEGVEIDAETESLFLPDVLPNAPTLKISGEAHLEVPPEGPVQVRAKLDPTVYEELVVPGFIVKGEIPEAGGFHIGELQARQRGAVLEGQGMISPEGDTRLELSARFPDIGADPNLRKLVPNARGGLSAEFDLSMPADPEQGLDVQGKATMRGLRYGSFAAERLTVVGRAHGKMARPELSLSVEATGMEVGGHTLGASELRVRGGPAVYTVTGRVVDPAERTLEIEARVRRNRRGLQLDSDNLSLDVGHAHWRGLITGLSYDYDGGFRLQRLMLGSRSERLELTADVTPGPSPDAVRASMTNFDLSLLRALWGEAFPLEGGRATTQLEVTGDIAHPDFTLSGLVTEGRVDEERTLTANYFAAYTRGQLEFDAELAFEAHGAVALRGNARADARAPEIVPALLAADYDVELAFDGLLLSLVPQLDAEGIDGALTGSLHARGYREMPTFTGDLSLAALSLPGVDELDLTGNLDYGGDELNATLNVADGRGQVGKFKFDATVPWAIALGTAPPEADLLGGPWTLSGKTVARRPQDLPRPLGFELPIPATLGTRFKLHRTNGQTTGEAVLALVAVEDVKGSPCRAEVRPDARVELSIDSNETRFDLTVMAGGRRLAGGSGRIFTPFDEWLDERQVTAPSNLHFNGDVDVPSFSDVPFLCAEGKGSMHAKVRLADLLSPRPRVEVDLDSSFSPRSVGPDATGRQEIRTCEASPVVVKARIEADHTRAAVGGRMAGCGGGATNFVGQLPLRWAASAVMPELRPGGELDAELAFSGAQLRPLLARAPGIQSGEAVADGDLRVQGPVGDLRYTGTLRIRDGHMLVAATAQQLEEVEAEVHFVGDSAQLTRLHAMAERGTVDMAGRWRFEHGRPRHAELVVSTESFPVRSDGVTMAWITGGAAIEADIGPERSRTAIKVHRLKAQLPPDVGGNVQPLDAHPDVEIASDENLELQQKPYIMEFTIDARTPMTVTRADLDAELASEVAVTYAGDDMRVGGYVEIVRGEFDAFGRSFSVSQGRVRFRGTRKLDPDLQLRAAHTLAATGEVVNLTIQGRLSDPDILFSSSACPGEAGAISLLLSGTCPQGSGGGAEGDNAAAFGGGLLGGLMATRVGAAGPRVGVESRGGNTTTISAGIELPVPEIIDRFVKKVYVEGGRDVVLGGNDGSGTQQTQQASSGSVDLLLEVYFPHHLVGSGRVRPGAGWGIDFTWEP